MDLHCLQILLMFLITVQNTIVLKLLLKYKEIAKKHVLYYIRTIFQKTNSKEASIYIHTHHANTTVT